MEHSAAHRVLALPELLALILDFLEDDTRTLFSATQVNSLWNDHGVSVLWREPPSRALLRIPSMRRQRYANYIQALDFDAGDDGDAHSQYTRLHFPQLRYVSIDTYRPRDSSPWVRQYLQPNLREFLFYGGNVHDDLSRLLSEHCPRLTTLLIDNIGQDFPEANLVAFLERFQELKQITLSYPQRHQLIPAALFSHLAERKSLTLLRLMNRIPASAVRSVKNDIEQPFPKLETFALNIGPDLLPAVTPMLKSVKVLELEIWSDSSDLIRRPLRHLAALQDLEVLNFGFVPPQDLILEDLVALKKFTKLRELHLSDESTRTIHMMPDTCTEIFKSLDQLQAITLATRVEALHSEDGDMLLTTLGQCCPRLETCDLEGIFHPEKLKLRDKTLFPSLTELRLGAIVPWVSKSVQSANACADEIRRHAPKLQVLDVNNLGGNSDFLEEVMRCWDLSSQTS